MYLEEEFFHGLNLLFHVDLANLFALIFWFFSREILTVLHRTASRGCGLLRTMCGSCDKLCLQSEIRKEDFSSKFLFSKHNLEINFLSKENSEVFLGFQPQDPHGFASHGIQRLRIVAYYVRIL